MVSRILRPARTLSSASDHVFWLDAGGAGKHPRADMRELLKNSFFVVGLVQALRQIPVDFRRARWCLGRAGDIQEYLDTHPVRKLQIGSGYITLPGFLNTDIFPDTRQPNQIYLDATRRFPIPDASFDYVYSEHMIEHIWWPDAQNMLRESFRILKPGGKIRISTPNLDSIISLRLPPDSPIKRQYIKLSTDKHVPHADGYRAGFVINNFYWDFGHYFLYDDETLRLALEKPGFTDIKRWDPQQSDEPVFTKIESHQTIVGDEVNQFESIIMQAVKPA